MRRLLHVAMTRARERLVLAYPARTERGAAQPPSPFAEEARAAVGGEWEEREEELFGPAETLHSTFRLLRDELLDHGRAGRRAARRAALRHRPRRLARRRALPRAAQARALLERAPEGQSVADALPEVNARLLQAATAEQREIFETSALDEYLLDAERDERCARGRSRRAPSRRSRRSCRAAATGWCCQRVGHRDLPDVPAEVQVRARLPDPAGADAQPALRDPRPPGARALPRRRRRSRSLPELLGLLEAGWRRGGFGDSDEERQLRAKAAQRARSATTSASRARTREPVWFERSFPFQLGPHTLRGRVDRVDRLPDGGYELIDYKTGRPKTAAQLREDVQLSLYAVGAREAWQLEAAQQAYYYVLDDEKVPVDRSEDDREWITETVLEVADGILGQGFEPTPSLRGVLDVRLPDRLPGRRALTLDVGAATTRGADLHRAPDAVAVACR